MSANNRSPFANDDDNDAPRRRMQQPQMDDGRDSQYQAWDSYLKEDKTRNSGAGGIGMGFMNGDDSDSEDEHSKPPQSAQKNRALFDAANVHGIAPPAPVAVRLPGHQQQHQDIAQPQPRGPPVDIRVNTTSPAMPIPRAPVPAFMQAPSPSPSPSLAPHPLNAPSTPITPVFARPSMQETREGIKFTDKPIMRGNSDDPSVTRGTAKGEDFWRRFSMYAKDDKAKAPSSWLSRHNSGYKRMGAWVWCVGIAFLIVIGGAVGLGWYVGRGQPAAAPVVIGGGESRTVETEAETKTGRGGATPTTSRVLSAPPVVETKRALAPELEELFEDAIVDVPVKHHYAEAHAKIRRSNTNRMAMEELD